MVNSIWLAINGGRVWVAADPQFQTWVAINGGSIWVATN